MDYQISTNIPFKWKYIVKGFLVLHDIKTINTCKGPPDGQGLVLIGSMAKCDFPLSLSLITQKQFTGEIYNKQSFVLRRCHYEISISGCVTWGCIVQHSDLDVWHKPMKLFVSGLLLSLSLPSPLPSEEAKYFSYTTIPSRRVVSDIPYLSYVIRTGPSCSKAG